MTNQPMRRTKQQLSDPEEIASILEAVQEAHIGMAEGSLPYVVPMNFGWERQDKQFTVYLHCAGEGRKLPLLKSGNPVCFEAAQSGALKEAAEACNYGIKYRSLIAWGRPEEVTDGNQKQKALNLIMKKYTQREFDFDKTMLLRTRVFKILLEELTAKRSS